MLSAFKSVPVISYTSISDHSGITVENFGKQMKALAEGGYTPISAVSLHEFMQGDGEVPDKPVLISFDGCFFDNWVNAMPILKEFNFRAVFFCITGFLHDTPRRPQKADTALPSIDSAFESALCGRNLSAFMSRQEIYETVHGLGHEVYSASASYPMIFRTSSSLSEINCLNSFFIRDSVCCTSALLFFVRMNTISKPLSNARAIKPVNALVFPL